MNPIHIFRAGSHVASDGSRHTITAADIAACAGAYARSVHDAPLVVGHPKTDDPAYGWVDGLTAQGDDLFATPTQIEPEFAELVMTGRFPKRSAAFYGPTHPANPKPGSYYLKHVGFLGAAAPSVKGLRPVAFAEEPGVIEFADWNGLTIARLFGNVRDFLIGQFGKEKADQVITSDDIASLTVAAAQPDPDADDGDTPDFGEPALTTQAKPTQAELDARAQELAAREAEFAENRRTARRGEITTFVDSLVTAAKLPTGLKDQLVAFMEGIPAEGTIEFAEGGKPVKAAPTDWLKAFLIKALPVLVSRGEHAPHRAADVALFSEGGPAAIDPKKIYAIHNGLQG